MVQDLFPWFWAFVHCCPIFGPIYRVIWVLDFDSVPLFSNVSWVITPSPEPKDLPHSVSALSSCSSGDSKSCPTNQELGALTKQLSSRLKLSGSWNASLMDEGTLETPIPKCRFFTGNFCLGWCSNFVGSDSGQKQSVKLLQNIWSTT